jgi:hypothetical protein
MVTSQDIGSQCEMESSGVFSDVDPGRRCPFCGTPFRLFRFGHIFILHRKMGKVIDKINEIKRSRVRSPARATFLKKMGRISPKS